MPARNSKISIQALLMCLGMFPITTAKMSKPETSIFNNSLTDAFKYVWFIFMPALTLPPLFPISPSSPFLQVVYLISISSCCLLLWFSKMMCLDLFISCFQNLLHFLPPSLPSFLLEKTNSNSQNEEFPLICRKSGPTYTCKNSCFPHRKWIAQHLNFVLAFILLRF